MNLSVVVPTLNGRGRLAACLDALAAAAPDAEVIVVNGPSADGTTGMVRERGDVDVLVEISDRTVGVARNAGLAVATGEAVAFVDYDNRVESGWREAVAAGLDELGVDISSLADESPPDLEAATDPAPYYWVNQNTEEIEGEYLRAPAQDRFQYDLPKLEVGDRVFSYNDGLVVGYHEVTTPATIVSGPDDEQDYYRVETAFTRFSPPLAFADVFKTLWDHRLEQYYPIHAGGINQ